jgi:hypothetical protein
LVVAKWRLTRLYPISELIPSSSVESAEWPHKPNARCVF